MTLRRKVMMSIAVAAIVLLVCELFFRGYLLLDRGLEEMVNRHRFENAPEERMDLLIEPHPYFVYTHSTLRSDVNSWGFNFSEMPLEKPSGTSRILCLGGSTTAGSRSWPYWLGEELESKGYDWLK